MISSSESLLMLMITYKKKKMKMLYQMTEDNKLILPRLQLLSLCPIQMPPCLLLSLPTHIPGSQNQATGSLQPPLDHLLMSYLFTRN